MLHWKPPQPVVETAERYKKDGEICEFSPMEYRLYGGSYYAACYNPNKENIWMFLDGDGSRLKKGSMKDIVTVILSVNALFNDLRFLKKAEKNRHDRKYQRSYHLITQAEQSINPNHPVYKDFLAFKNVFDTIIRYSPIIRRKAKEIREIGKQLHYERYLDEPLYQRLMDLRYDMIHGMFQQNRALVESYQSRKKVVRHLWKQGKIWLAIRLAFFYLFDNKSNQLSNADRQTYRELREIFIEGKGPLDIPGETEKAIQRSRNPK
ncbi:MAG: hypothetical protein M0Z65_04415 [Firmicutes bacterium]|nr:hypothetical protein [Bacillota bacterium]